MDHAKAQSELPNVEPKLAVVVCALRLWRHYQYNETFDMPMNNKKPKVCVLAEEAKYKVTTVDGVS